MPAPGGDRAGAALRSRDVGRSRPANATSAGGQPPAPDLPERLADDSRTEEADRPDRNPPDPRRAERAEEGYFAAARSASMNSGQRRQRFSV